MIWENGIETCIISYRKWSTSLGSMQDTGCLGLVHWDDPEGWYREGGGRDFATDITPPFPHYWLPFSSCKTWLVFLDLCQKLSSQKSTQKLKHIPPSGSEVLICPCNSLARQYPVEGLLVPARPSALRTPEPSLSSAGWRGYRRYLSWHLNFNSLPKDFFPLKTYTWNVISFL